MTAEHDTTEHDAMRERIAELQRERQDSRDTRAPLVPPLRLVRCERPHLARGLR